MPEQRTESVNVRVCKKGDKTDFSTYRGLSLLSNTYINFVHHPAIKAHSLCRGNHLVSSSVDFDVTGQSLIIHSSGSGRGHGLD